MWWKIFQAFVFMLVLFSNVHWQWTPNPYVAAFIGAVVAFLVSVALAAMIDLSRKLRGQWKLYRRL